MTEREQEAQRAGLQDMALLRLHEPEAPMATVLADLRTRFPAAFASVRGLTRAEYDRARDAFVQDAQRTAFQRRVQAECDRVYGARA